MDKRDSLNAPNSMTIEFEYKEIRDERLVKLFQQSYKRKNKYATVIHPPDSNTLLNDTTMYT